MRRARAGHRPRFDRRVTRSALGALVLVALAVVILAVAVFNQSSKPTPAPGTTPAPAVSGDSNATNRIVPAERQRLLGEGVGPRAVDVDHVDRRPGSWRMRQEPPVHASNM